MKIKLREVGEVRIIDLQGKLTFNDGDQELRDTVKRLLDGGHAKILINLKELSYVDTTGIGELVAAKKRAAAKGGDTKLMMPSKTVYNILSIVSLHLIFDIFDDEQKAVASF
jgi:anti-sigma B factor antagonist